MKKSGAKQEHLSHTSHSNLNLSVTAIRSTRAGSAARIFGAGLGLSKNTSEGLSLRNPKSRPDTFQRHGAFAFCILRITCSACGASRLWNQSRLAEEMCDSGHETQHWCISKVCLRTHLRNQHLFDPSLRLKANLGEACTTRNNSQHSDGFSKGFRMLPVLCPQCSQKTKHFRLVERNATGSQLNGPLSEKRWLSCQALRWTDTMTV